MPGQLRINEEALALLPKRKQDRAVRALRELEETRKANPLLFYNNPDFGKVHPKQPIFHGFDARRLILLGGNQSGKTLGGTADCLIQSVDRKFLPPHLLSKRRFKGNKFKLWVGAPGREEIEDYIFDKINEWVPPSELLGGSWKTAYDKQHHVLTMKNAQWAFKTYEQETNKWGGATLDAVWFDEEPPKDKYGEARIRVMRRGGYILFTMTPTEGLTHMFEEYQPYVELALQKGKGKEWYQDEDIGLILVDMDDNPWLTEADKREALKGFTREEIQARKSGKFVALHGLIYGDFDSDTHEIPELQADEDGRYSVLDNKNIIIGIDPGIRHACGVLWTYLAPDDTMVAFEEGYYQGMTIQQVCEQIHRVNAHYDIQPIYYVIDPAARNRQSQTGRSDQMEFADHGIVALPGQNDVRPGINRVKERFQNNRLFITANCENLKKELQRYRWRKPPRTEDDSKEAPVKKDDHLVDPLRYICMSRPYLPDMVIESDETPEQRLMREDIEQYSKPRPSAA